MGIHDIQQIIRTFNPDWLSPSERYKHAVRKLITENSIVLDIGCGRTDFMVDIFKAAKKVIGQDLDGSAINEHPYLHQRIIGDFEALNILEPNSIDLAVSAWTLEHLQEPEKLFAQLSRLLRPGGYFIALTPNHIGLPSLISKLIPNSLHPKIVHKLWGRTIENTYPTFYRANSVRTLNKLAKGHGIHVQEIIKMKDSSYYVAHPSFTKIIYFLHSRLIPKTFCESFLIVIQKPENLQ